MPYYIYRIKPFSQFEKVAEFGAFKEASAQAKVLRAPPPTDKKEKIQEITNQLQKYVE